MGRRADRDDGSFGRVITAWTLVAPVIAALATGPEAGAQCQYQITAVIAADPCPPPFNNVPATIGTAMTEGPDPAVVGFYCPCGAGTADSAFVWRAITGLVEAWGQTGSPADLNDDGVVNVLDVIILLLDFGASATP